MYLTLAFTAFGNHSHTQSPLETLHLHDAGTCFIYFFFYILPTIITDYKLSETAPSFYAHKKYIIL